MKDLNRSKCLKWLEEQLSVDRMVSGCEGRVTEINMRYTILSGDNTTYMIPNAALFTNPLELKASKQ